MPLQSILTQALPNGVIPVGQPGAAGGPGGPAPPGQGSGWEVKVLAAPDYYKQLAQFSTQILTSVQFVKQLNDKGSGTVTLSMDDAFWSTTLPGGLTAHNILDYEHLWQVWQDGVLRFEFLGETVTEQLIDPGEQRVVTVTGPGTVTVLTWAMAMPPGFPNIIYKLDAISDGFSETDVNGNLVLDTNLWNQAQPLNRIALNPSGTAQVTGSPGTTYLGTSVFDGTETLISGQVRPIVSPNAAGVALNGSQLTQFYVQDMNNSANYALIGMSGTSFYCRFGSGASSQTKVIASATSFNAASGTSGTYNYDYWMISEHAGSFYFWTSNDGQNWTQQWVVKHSWSAKTVAFFFSAAYSVDNTQAATLTSLNSNVTNSSLGGATYLTQPIMSVWLQTLRAAQGRGTVPFVTTRMTTTGDSYGNPWTDTQSVQIANGTDLLSLLQGHASMVNADWIMEPGFLLKVAIPVGGKVTLGTDRSQQIIFREAAHETGKTRTRTRSAIANLVGVINADGRTVTASDSTSIANWAQREAWLAAGVQVTEQDIAIVASAGVQQTAGEQLAWTMTITPNVAGKTVFRDFAVGDWIGLERPDYSAVDAVRVIAIAVNVDATGVETHELTLVSYIAWLQEQFNYVQQKMGGNLLSVNGTTQVAGGITSRVTPSVFAPTLAGLGDVLSAGAGGNAPLVYDPVTGKWVPAGTQNPDTGGTAGMSVSTSSGTTTISGGSTTVAAPSPAPADTGSPGPAASTTTTPTGHVITDSTGTQRVIVGTQSDGTVTVKTVNAPAPSAPDIPTCVAGALGVIVGWDGLLGGAGPLSDFKLVQVHGSTATGFTPSAGTLQGTMVAGGLFGIGGLIAGTAYYVKLVAVNLANVVSPASAQATATPTTVAAGIGVGSLPGNAIQTGTITSSQISPTAGILGSQLAANAGIVAGQVAFTASAIGGGPAVTVSTTAPSSPNTNDLWFNGSNGYTLERWTGSAWTVYQYGTQALSAGSVTAAVIAANTITAAQIATGTITATQIAGGTITATQIASGTITASQIQAGTITGVLLAANIVKAGIIDGTVVTGSTIQNSSTSPRTSINPDGSISISNASGTVIFSVGPDGTMYWYTGTGALSTELQPGGTNLIYAGATGPQGWDFEPPAGPVVLGSLSSATSAASYGVPVGSAVAIGQQVMVWAACSGATSATGVTDSKGNTYTRDTNVTTNQQLQVFYCNNINTALTTSDTITTTYAATNTQTKVILVAATPGLAAAGKDASNTTNGSSAAPSCGLSPAMPGDMVYAVLANAAAGGVPSAIADGWMPLGTIGTAPYLTVWYGTTASAAALTAGATIVSAAWAMTVTAFKVPGASTAQAWVNQNSSGVANSSIAETNAWSNSGSYALKVTSTGGGTWGTLSPLFPAVANMPMSMEVSVYTPTALSAMGIGFNWYTSGGTYISSSAGDQGNIATTAASVSLFTITGATVPSNATQARFFVQESATDASGTNFSIDTVQVAGGLVYSLSPTGGTDALGNTYEQGLQFTGLAGLTNVLSVQDWTGNVLGQIDGQGNVSGQIVSAVTDFVVAGQSVSGLINALPQGVIARGWTPGGAWPSTAIGTTETAVVEVDQTLSAGRAYKILVVPQDFIPNTAGTQYVQNVRYTTDGSTPTTSSSVLGSNRVVTCSNANLNHVTPYHEYLTPNLGSDTNYRLLVTGFVQAGTFKYQNSLELRVEDLGLWNTQENGNNGTALGSGTTGAAGKGNHQNTYYATATHSYYGATAGNGRSHYGKRNDNSNMWQSCEYSPSDRAFYEGDQYSFAVFNYSQIASDLSGATINNLWLRLNCNYSWYSTGMTVILGWTSYTGVFGDPFQPGVGTHSNLTHYHIGNGQTLTQDVTSVLATPFQTGGASGIVLGPAASYDGYTDQNNFGSIFGYSSTDHNRCPALIVNFTK
jgi:hypothetical protein